MMNDPQLLLLLIPVLLFSVIIHELAHGYTALFLGDNTAERQGRLTLNPLVHLDPIMSVALPIVTMLTAGVFIGAAKPIPFNPLNLRDPRWDELKIAIAGPISNVVIALVFAVILNLLPLFGYYDQLLTTGLFYVIFINILLAVFNMLPVPPLDGSKILFAIIDKPQIRIFMERYSLILIIGLLFVLFNTNILGSITAWLSQVLII